MDVIAMIMLTSCVFKTKQFLSAVHRNKEKEMSSIIMKLELQINEWLNCLEHLNTACKSM